MLSIFVAFLTVPLAALASNDQQSRVSTSTSQIASLPSQDSVAGLAVSDGRPVAVGRATVWVFDEDEGRWERVMDTPPGRVIGVSGGDRRLFLFLDSGEQRAATRVEQVSLAVNTPVAVSLPAIPAKMLSVEGVLAQHKLFVAGTTVDGLPRMFALDLAVRQPPWVEIDTWPGGSGAVTSMISQKEALYLTVRDEGQNADRLLQWSPGQEWVERDSPPARVVKGTGRPIGQSHALYLVQDSANDMLTYQMMMFHTTTGSWARLASLGSRSIRSGLGWKNGILWEGEEADGSGIAFAFTELQSGTTLLTPWDWSVFGLYLTVMLGTGLWFYLRHTARSSADYFVGGRAVPFWAAGISLYATNTSSISYIAIPAKSFETNWQYLTNNLIAVVGLVFVALWVVPLLRRLDLISVFHYLEMRFHPVIRMLSSAFFILVQLGSRLSVILLLPSLAISAVTGIDVVWSILIIGGTTIAYTALGGIKAVIWTDVMQLVVMFGGALLSIAFVIVGLDGGVGEFLALTRPENKMQFLDWSWDLTEATVWGFVFLVLFDVILTFPKNQVLMQRVLSTKSDKQAGWSVWTYAALMIPGSVLFYLIGTALYVYYKAHPERLDPLLAVDTTFPQFIAAELPIGIAGLIVAGIFAASMSTLSSIINSVATLVSIDFYGKLVNTHTPSAGVGFAKAMTVIVGLAGMGLAYLLSLYDIHSLFDTSIELAGLLGGGFAGAYTLGMFTRRANWQGVLVGVAASITVTMLAWFADLVHVYFYLAISILTCISVGYAASWLFRPPERLAGLTVYKDAISTGSEG